VLSASSSKSGKRYSLEIMDWWSTSWLELSEAPTA
jgi:hypothetical protein